jgi:hypothetical protein
MSRIVSGDKNRLPENEGENSFREGFQSRDSIEEADRKALDVIDYGNQGKSAHQLHSLGNKAL